MQELFLNKNDSVSIGELGFNEPCFAYYSYNKFIIGNRFYASYQNTADTLKKVYADDSIILAPTYQQAFAFFRDECCVAAEITCWRWMDEFRFKVSDKDTVYKSKVYNDYEEAEKACIEYIIGLIKIEKGI